MFFHPCILYRTSFAKYAAAFFKMSRSCRKILFSARSLFASSSKVSLSVLLDCEPVEPVEPLILVVEDNVTNQKITCKLLSKLGYQSIVAENGQEAVEMLAKQRQDIALILMDCRMPIMDGLQATKEIRASGDNIAIVALTANNTDEDRDACIGVGMDEFLAKPINKNKLQAVLQHFLSV